MEKKTSDTFKINPVNTIAIYGNAGAGKDFTASYIRLVYDVMYEYFHNGQASENSRYLFNDSLFEDGIHFNPEEFTDFITSLDVFMHLPVHKNADLNEEEHQKGENWIFYGFGRSGDCTFTVPKRMKHFYFAYALKKQLADSLGVKVEKMNEYDFKAKMLYDLRKCRMADITLDEINPETDYVFSAEEYDIFHHDFNRFASLNPTWETYGSGKDFYMTIREMLVYYGTYVMRRHFNDSIWLHKVLFAKEFEDAEYRIITDLRFPNEYKKLREQGAFIIKVVNPDQAEQKVSNVAESFYDEFEPDYVFESSRDHYVFQENLYALCEALNLFPINTGK